MIRTLSTGMRTVQRLALWLAGGAVTVPRTDGLVEVYHNGQVSLVSASEHELALDVFRQIETERLNAVGFTRPYSALQVVDIMPFLEDALIDRQEKAAYRAVFIKGDTGGCPYWRCTEPARLISERFSDVAYVEATSEISYDGLLAFDIIVVQRALFGRDTAAIAAILDRLHAAGRKIVYEIDDDLWTLLHDNNCYMIADDAARRDIEYIVNASDAIFTTTDELKARLGFPEKTFVLPNSLDLSLFPPKPPREGRDNILFVLWHGGDSHEPDLAWMAKPMSQLIRQHADLEQKIGKQIIFGFMGYFPSLLQPFMEFQFPVMVDAGGYDKDLKREVRSLTVKGRQGVKYIKGVDADSFHSYLYHLEPDICFAPLKPGLPFQDAKSNIKVMESTIAGAACVVSDVGPYRFVPDNCVIKARTPEQMVQGIKDLMRQPDRRRELHANALDWVTDNYDLRNNAKLWHDALSRVRNGVGPELSSVAEGA